MEFPQDLIFFFDLDDDLLALNEEQQLDLFFLLFLQYEQGEESGFI